MTWLVFAASGLLVLAGAISVIFGAPIIQLERGWAEVISGSAAISGGCVTFALGVVLLRLQSIQGALMHPEQPVRMPAAEVDAIDAVAETFLAARELRPTVEPFEPLPAVVPEVATAPVEPRPSLWKRARSAPSADAKEEPVLSVDPWTADDPQAEPALPIVPDRRGAARSDLESDRMFEIGAQSPGDEARSAAPQERPEPASNRWLKPSLFRTRSAPAAPAFAPPDHPEADFAPHPHEDHAAPEPLYDAAPAITSTDHEPFDAAPAEPAEDKPTVVGRYQAGVASYVMYSDGTINVETEGGDVHRFGSMDELKAFIARQDTSVF